MIAIRKLTPDDLDTIGEALPLHRFDGWSSDSTYLVAWDGDDPVGHLHIGWAGTELGVPELQDAYVRPERRGEGIGSALTREGERVVAARGHRECSISVSQTNDGARRLYERLGYHAADHPPKRVQGRIEVRGGTIDVDDTILYFSKAVDSAPPRSS